MAKSNFPNGEVAWSDKKHILWFPLTMTKYSVANGRLYINSGMLVSREDECLLYRIMDITLTRSLLQMICGTGTIELHTKDRSTPVIRLENIKHPTEVKRLLSDMIEKDRIHKNVQGKEMYGAASNLDPQELHELEGIMEDDCDCDCHNH